MRYMPNFEMGLIRRLGWEDDVIAKHYIVSGRVHGVGFRYFVVRQARALGLTGWVRNLPDGTVEAVAAGPEASVSELEAALRQGPGMARVDHLTDQEAAMPRGSGFEAVATPR